MPGHARMNQVLLVQLAIPANSFEQEWDQRGVVLLCQFAENALETGGVLGPEIRWDLHSRENDFDLRVLRFGLVDDRLEVRFQRFQRLTAQAIIRAELEEENIDRALQEPVDPAQPACARVAAEAGV